MKLFRKGQGATEYLLMLAAVLVIVAIAVYYVMGASGAPTIIASVELKSDNTVWIKGETGCSIVADWSFEYKGGSTITEWQSTLDSMGPGDEIELTALANKIVLGNTVTIRYDATVKSAVIDAHDKWVVLV